MPGLAVLSVAELRRLLFARRLAVFYIWRQGHHVLEGGVSLIGGRSALGRLRQSRRSTLLLAGRLGGLLSRNCKASRQVWIVVMGTLQLEGPGLVAAASWLPRMPPVLLPARVEVLLREAPS